MDTTVNQKVTGGSIISGVEQPVVKPGPVSVPDRGQPIRLPRANRELTLCGVSRLLKNREISHLQL
ncbi:MAG: hypothetical protein NVS4B12_23080 [Ktedonobacteraceae bacterium]